MNKKCFSTLGCHDRSLSEVIDLAKKYGIDAVEIRGLDGILDNGEIPCFKDENIVETRKKFLENGITPLVLGTTCMFHDREAYDKAMIEGMTAIEIAAKVGFKAIRVFGDHITGDESECVSLVAKGIRQLCDYAEKYGVTVYHEIHGEFNTVSRLDRILEVCADSPAFAFIWDVCHTRKTHPDWQSFYHRFKPYIKHVHLKDVTESGHVIPGEGIMPLKEIADYLTRDGYDGYFSLEWERKWHPELPIIEEALDGYFATV